MEKRDVAALFPVSLPEPITFASQRQFVRSTLLQEVDMRSNGPNYVGADQESPATLAYRSQMNSEGSPSEAVAAGYRWRPGTELLRSAGSVPA